jgi:hypothetical protein
MKQYFLKFSGLTIMMLWIQLAAFSQDDNDSSKPKSGKITDND